MKIMRKLSFFIALMAMVVILGGCRQPRVQPPRFKLAVLNFALAREVKTPKEIKGWWFGARDIYYNPYVGETFADVLADEISKRCPFIDVYSRMDIKYYLLSKREILKRHFPELKEAELTKTINELDPVDIGRELGVDKVISGVIYDCHTSHHRTFHWWSSVVEAEVKLIDVDSGKVEWQNRMRLRKKFLSWLGTAEVLASKMVKAMEKELFYR
ncbi:hypothetical protein J7M23_07450 [Candidatus Sumerlaeota bacterium]|nr:hypothetical protein [Candidatus Sumerlaeota bacterium]